jgi:hypothetical protein
MFFDSMQSGGDKMEFIVSSLFFKGAQKYGSFYFDGFPKHQNGYISFLDGDCNDEIKLNTDNVEKLETCTYKGMFNYIRILNAENKILIKNDILGRIACYYYYDGVNFIASNVFWNILNIKQNLNVDVKRLSLNFASWTAFEANPVYFENVCTVPAAAFLEFNNVEKKVNIKKYWSFAIKHNESLSAENATLIADENIKKRFEYIKNKVGNAAVGFGNSGGLDSRLIASYGVEYGLNLVGFQINQEGRFFKSQSRKNAEMISSLFGIKTKFISPLQGDYLNRCLLDIRNNPFGPAQFLKVDPNQMPNCEFLIAGHPGTILGSWVPSEVFSKIESEQLALLLNGYVQYRRIAGTSKKSFLNKIYNLFFKGQYSKDTRGQMLSKSNFEESRFDNVFNDKNKENRELIFLSIKEFITANTEKSPLELWLEYINIAAYGRFNYHGGFESCCRTKPTYFLYYPEVFEGLLCWGEKLFKQRGIVENLVKKRNLALIPDQGGSVLGHTGKFEVIKGRIVHKFRGTGLNYSQWIKDENLRSFVIKVLQKENEIFDSIVNRKYVLRNMEKLGESLLSICKNKILLDIVCNKEYDLLDSIDMRIQ